MQDRQYTLLTPCHFGLESVLKREISALGYPITKVEDGKVYWEGGKEAIARGNIFLRTTEKRKVLGDKGQFHKKQAVQSFRYPVDHEESCRGKTEDGLS